jgi:hypothetical protein
VGGNKEAALAVAPCQWRVAPCRNRSAAVHMWSAITHIARQGLDRPTARAIRLTGQTGVSEVRVQQQPAAAVLPLLATAVATRDTPDELSLGRIHARLCRRTSSSSSRPGTTSSRAATPAASAALASTSLPLSAVPTPTPNTTAWSAPPTIRPARSPSRMLTEVGGKACVYRRQTRRRHFALIDQYGSPR